MRYTARAIVVLVACLALAACGTGRFAFDGEAALQADMTAPGARPDPGAAARALNAYRSANGRGAVRHDASLSAIAQAHSEAMARAGTMTHTLNGANFQQRLEANGYRVRRAYENIGAGHRNLAQAMDGWQQSRAHRANMLKNDVTRFGIGAAQADGRYGVYWTLVLARPLDRLARR